MTPLWTSKYVLFGNREECCGLRSPPPLSTLLFSRRDPKVTPTCWPQRLLFSRIAEQTSQTAPSHQLWDCRLPLTRVENELRFILYSDLISDGRVRQNLLQLFEDTFHPFTYLFSINV